MASSDGTFGDDDHGGDDHGAGGGGGDVVPPSYYEATNEVRDGRGGRGRGGDMLRGEVTYEVVLEYPIGDYIVDGVRGGCGCGCGLELNINGIGEVIVTGFTPTPRRAGGGPSSYELRRIGLMDRLVSINDQRVSGLSLPRLNTFITNEINRTRRIKLVIVPASNSVSL